MLTLMLGAGKEEVEVELEGLGLGGGVVGGGEGLGGAVVGLVVTGAVDGAGRGGVGCCPPESVVARTIKRIPTATRAATARTQPAAPRRSRAGPGGGVGATEGCSSVDGAGRTSVPAAWNRSVGCDMEAAVGTAPAPAGAVPLEGVASPRSMAASAAAEAGLPEGSL